MKFIHIADIHLGATPDSNMPWGPQREKEIWTSFQDIVRICNEEKVDLLLIAGDMFHRQPLVRELKEVNYILSRLESAKAVIMAGNHDYIGPRSYYQDFAWMRRSTSFCRTALR
jgi:DNA repair exonuclease SbcCD nuclease subunit